jgi:hypothetical protein
VLRSQAAQPGGHGDFETLDAYIDRLTEAQAPVGLLTANLSARCAAARTTSAQPTCEWQRLVDGRTDP